MGFSWDEQGRTPYEVMGVRRDVGPSELRRVYRRLAKRYHPDRTGAEADSARMGVINRAYEVLNDPAQRQALDSWLDRKTLNEGRIWETEEEPSELDIDLEQVLRDVACERCGRLDASIRLATWPAVASFVLVSARPSFGGVNCAACRDVAALRAIALTGLLGWWSPQGVLYSYRALHQALSDRPVEPAQENARILRWVGLALTAKGKLDEARDALKVSLGLLRRRETSSLLRRLGPAPTTPSRTFTSRSRASRWSLGALTTLLSFSVVFLTLSQFTAAEEAGPVAAQPTTQFDEDEVQLIEVSYSGERIRYAMDDVLAVELATAFVDVREKLEGLERVIDASALDYRTGQAELEALDRRRASGDASAINAYDVLAGEQASRLSGIKEQMREQEQLRLELRAAWLELGTRHLEEE